MLVAVLICLPAAAQQRGMYGGISTGQMVGSVSDPGFASRLGATVSGLPQTSIQIPNNTGIYAAPRTHNRYLQGRTNTVVVPYGVPLVYGYAPTSYDLVPPRAISNNVENQPGVIINQYYTPDNVRPPAREIAEAATRPVRTPEAIAADRKQREEDAEASRKPTITLLAFKDSSVAAVIAYWTQEDQLHYVTKAFRKNIISLASLDRSTTEQLNRERNVEFSLE
ncbi:MAG: hypothetical protein HYZ37_03665 [Candidatus Solibacter usitatus]|nr:hypothetical protein [Candidatus Solibacter usitatus]